eukprot:2037870-Rhodomonas_salina.1
MFEIYRSQQLYMEAVSLLGLAVGYRLMPPGAKSIAKTPCAVCLVRARLLISPSGTTRERAAGTDAVVRGYNSSVFWHSLYQTFSCWHLISPCVYDATSQVPTRGKAATPGGSTAPPYLLRACYAMSSTCTVAMRCPVPRKMEWGIRYLGMWYGESGIDLGKYSEPTTTWDVRHFPRDVVCGAREPATGGDSDAPDPGPNQVLGEFKSLCAQKAVDFAACSVVCPMRALCGV